MAVITPELVGGKNVTAFLDLLAWAEGTADGKNNGYGVIVTGLDGPHEFDDYSDHPFAHGRAAIRFGHGPDDFSTASGRYQIMRHTWRDYLPILHLTDFSPLSQDLLAARLLHERGAIRFLQNSEVAAAIHACSNIWASLPGNNYGQGGKSLDALLNQFSILARG